MTVLGVLRDIRTDAQTLLLRSEDESKNVFTVDLSRMSRVHSLSIAIHRILVQFLTFSVMGNL